MSLFGHSKDILLPLGIVRSSHKESASKILKYLTPLGMSALVCWHDHILLSIPKYSSTASHAITAIIVVLKCSSSVGDKLTNILPDLRNGVSQFMQHWANGKISFRYAVNTISPHRKSATDIIREDYLEILKI